MKQKWVEPVATLLRPVGKDDYPMIELCNLILGLLDVPGNGLFSDFTIAPKVYCHARRSSWGFEIRCEDWRQIVPLGSYSYRVTFYTYDDTIEYSNSAREDAFDGCERAMLKLYRDLQTLKGIRVPTPATVDPGYRLVR